MYGIVVNCCSIIVMFAMVLHFASCCDRVLKYTIGKQVYRRGNKWITPSYWLITIRPWCIDGTMLLTNNLNSAVLRKD